LSSTIRGRRLERGQVLAIFAFGLVLILAVAALVFDVGQNLFERRKQQDAADAASLAGARYMVTAGCKAAPTLANCPEAVLAAREIVAAHGYDPDTQAAFHIPPIAPSPMAGRPGHIQVDIDSNRPSYFAGVLGLTSFRIAATAVAANIDSYALPYSFIALGDVCKAFNITGNGTFSAEGDIYAVSSCTAPGAIYSGGNRSYFNVDGDCGTAGTIDYGPSANPPTCGTFSPNSPNVVSDPLAGLGAPAIGTAAVPDPPTSPVLIGGGTLAAPAFSHCPGQSSAATQAAPFACGINPGAGASGGNPIVRIYPGVYYGGIKLSETSGHHLTVYMEPGIYYMAGGGFTVSGPIDLYTVDSGGTTYPATNAGDSGAMIFNSDDPLYRAGCIDGTYTGAGCISAIQTSGTEGGAIKLRGYDGPIYTSLIVFQDRDASSQPEMGLEGQTTMQVEGTIYLPEARFKFTGTTSGTPTYVLNAQVIADTIVVAGGGNLTLTYDPATALQLSGIGLVE
jgi:hypothetical protein